MELIVISAFTYFKDEGKIINKLFDNGLNILHIKKDPANSVQLLDLMWQIEPQYHERIALHQCHELKAEFGLNRLHYPEQMKATLQSSSLPADQVSSTSIHALKRLDELNGFAYTFFGPLFNSLSKKGYQGINDQEFRCPEADLKVIALGGITEKQVRQVADMGFDGLAVSGALWNAPDTALFHFKKIQSLC